MAEGKPIANSMLVLKEEFDDWAVLFDPDSGEAFGLNPVSVFIWKHLDGEHTVSDILEKLRNNCKNVPENVEEDVNTFIDSLLKKGFAGYEKQNEKV